MMEYENNVILVVDDNLNNIRIVIDYLKESGFETAVARNGHTGLERAKLLQPLLILLDVMMPEMDGFEACRRLKTDEATRDIPVIFMTALDGIDDKLKAFSAGGVDYISKPAQKEEVLARVTAHVKLRQQARELEASRKAAEQANKAKSTFLANMSHELRSPLGTILGFSELLQHDRNLTPGQMENLDVIRRSGEHLLRLIDRVLDLSKIEAGRLALEPHDFDLFALLHDMQETFRMRCEKKGLQFRLERAPDLPHAIHADELKLRQVLINLLTNAVKFTAEGSVTLRVHVAGSSDAPALHHSTSSITLAFDVEDSGIGIANEEQDGLFEAFSQTSSGRQAREGTGLGLTISQKFVQLMGGAIHVVSEVERGSSFSFELPCRVVEWKAEDHAPPDTRHVIGLAEGQTPSRLLIVDDNEDNRQLLRKLLSPVGFELREARNGREAIGIRQEWSPELIFMDMRMPIVDGYEATQTIRKQGIGGSGPDSRLPVIIAVTANSLLEERSAMFEAGCDAVIYKPFHEADIFETLQQHLGVTFEYEQSGTAPDSLPAKESEAIDIPGALASCPPEFLRKLKHVTEITEVNNVEKLLHSIQTDRPQLAKALLALADDFEYEIILRHLREAEKRQNA